MKISKIDSDLTIYKDNCVIIWGASGAGERIYKLLRGYQIDIAYFCDKDHNKWGTEFCGLKVISPVELDRLYTSKPCVVQIASSWEKEIAEELLKTGIENYITYSEAQVRLLSLKKYYVSLENPRIFDYYLNEFYSSSRKGIYVEAWNALMTPFFDNQGEVVILCMPPKTGDWTIMKTLDDLGVCYINLWNDPYRFTEEMREFIGDRKIKVITGIRDIISQNLSLVFQRVGEGRFWGWEECWKNGGDASALLLRHVKPNFSSVFTLMQRFFDEKFKDYMGINLYKYPFNKERGYSIIKQGNIEIFIYQLERLNEVYHSIFDFLGVSGDKLIMGNTAGEKWYYPYYKRAMSGIEISRDYFETCYNSEGLHHFYSDDDINKFRGRWMKNIKD